MPLISHDQIDRDFLSFFETELPDQDQRNRLLRFVLFGEKEKWFCFKDICEKNPDDIVALEDPRDNRYTENRPHNNLECKFMIGKFGTSLEDRIALRGFKRPS